MRLALPHTSPACSAPPRASLSPLPGLQVQFKLSSPEEALELQDLRDILSEKNLPMRDVNGFRRIILALTSSGEWGGEGKGRGVPACYCLKGVGLPATALRG